MSAAKRRSSQTTKRTSTSEPQLRNERELRRIADSVLRIARVRGVPETEVYVEEVIDALTRFANNAIHQNVAEHGVTVSMRTVLDGRTARLTTNRVDEDALRAAVENCLALAASQPQDPSLLPIPRKQSYRKINRFTPATAMFSAEDRARAVKRACDLAEENGQVAAGIFSSGQSQSVFCNSRGLFATYRQTQGEFSVTMQQGSAASWAKGNEQDVRRIDPIALAKVASDKATRAQAPVELEPGRYTVILEPPAVLDLIGLLFYDFSATAVADRRSCLSERLGQTLFGKNITITDDVYHLEQLGAGYDGEGMPRQKVTLVDQGVIKNLVYSRRSARKAGTKPTGHGFALPNEYGEAPINLVVMGGNSSIGEMISTTDRGLLVTRLWYIREVDPYEKMMTGMTRDGLFLVEKGQIGKAVRNFRFNQSVLEMLRNVQLLGPAHRASGEESFEMVVPAMKVTQFHMSEVTKF
jgi:predicted Zn-dependent protease